MNNWNDLVETYIVRGDIPSLPNPWDVEEPETYLQRLYRKSAYPEEFRQALNKVLNRVIHEENFGALIRALRLVKLIPHADFATTLQGIYFTARSKSQKGDNKEKYKEVSLLAIKAMYDLQPTLPRSDERRPYWEMMWISLLKDKEYVIVAYNGLRRLDISLALRQLPLLLSRSDLTREDLGVILRGTKRDLRNARVDLTEALAKTARQLTEEELTEHQPLLRDTFGNETIETALERAREDAEKELGSITALPVLSDDVSTESLRRQLFPKLAAWLKERTPVFAVALWLVDREAGQVHYGGQAGLHETEPEPPCVINFGDFVTGTVAQSREDLLRDLKSDLGPDVFRVDELRALGVRGVFSTFAQANEDKKPRLELVVNFFDASVEKLRRLQAPCVRNAGVAARATQQALATYTDYWVADLTTKLVEKPGLAEVARTFVQDISTALPCDQERVVLHLYNSVSKCLFSYLVYDTQNTSLSFRKSYGKESRCYPIGEGLAGYIAKLSTALRISDVTDKNKLPSGIRADLNHLGVDELSEGQGLNYLAMPVRGPAPSGFVGALTGVIEIYRPIEKGSGRVFTPTGEYILAELVKTVAPSMLGAYEKELRHYEPVAITVEEQLREQGLVGDVTSTLKRAEDDLRSEIGDFLKDWAIANMAGRAFLAFRTLFNSCTAFWIKPGTRFGPSEKAARLAFQQAILVHDDILLSSEAGVLVTTDLLTRFGVSREHRETLSSLRLVLVPLVYQARLDGIIGLEFDSDDQALNAVKEMQRLGQEAVITRFVRTSIMDMWLDYRRHFVLLLATFFGQLSKRAEDERHVSKQALINFVARGQAHLIPYEKSFAELMVAALKRFSSDAKCSLLEECENWKSFANNEQLDTTNIGAVKLLAMPSAVRVVLASSTAPLLWNGKATVSLVEDRTQSGWSRLRIEVPPNGHDDIRKLGLDLAKGVGKFQGWLCDSEIDENGITIMVPDVTSATSIPSC